MSRILEKKAVLLKINRCDIQEEKVFNMREERAEASKSDHIAVMSSVSAVMELYIRHLLAILHKWPNLFESHWKKLIQTKMRRNIKQDILIKNAFLCLSMSASALVSLSSASCLSPFHQYQILKTLTVNNSHYPINKN